MIGLPRPTDRPRVDKHSTGGLGDKVSLILAPLLACCGVDVPMISGRGLGLTGGTLDKLEAIEGFQVRLTPEQSSGVLRKVGAFIVGADENTAPADRRLYALRDVTGTVESVPLITASILSKKLAANLDALVMDVKVGSGAFMKTHEDASRLAKSLARVGSQAGLPTSVIMSDMDQPLGKAVGNAIEVNEAIDVLKGGGPPEVRELTIELSAETLVQVGVDESIESARTRLAREIDCGNAMQRWQEMVALQGGDPSKPLDVFPALDVKSAESGYVTKIDSVKIGEAVLELGGGRRRKEDQIDPRVGVTMLVNIGDRVENR